MDVSEAAALAAEAVGAVVAGAMVGFVAQEAAVASAAGAG